MAMNLVYLGVGGAWGANIEVAGVPTLFGPIESYVHAGMTIKNGVITAIDLDAVTAGTDHAALTNLAWEDSAHTGTALTFAIFDGSGLPLSDAKITWTANAAQSLRFFEVSGNISVFDDGGGGVASFHSDFFAGSRALITSAGKLISESSVTSTELGYVAGVTSAIQTQINAITWEIFTRTANFTTGTTRDSVFLCDDTSGNITATLTTPSYAQQIRVVKTAGGNTVTVSGEVISVIGDSLTIQYLGGAWVVVGDTR